MVGSNGWLAPAGCSDRFIPIVFRAATTCLSRAREKDKSEDRSAPHRRVFRLLPGMQPKSFRGQTTPLRAQEREVTGTRSGSSIAPHAEHSYGPHPSSLRRGVPRTPRPRWKILRTRPNDERGFSSRRRRLFFSRSTRARTVTKWIVDWPRTRFKKMARSIILSRLEELPWRQETKKETEQKRGGNVRKRNEPGSPGKGTGINDRRKSPRFTGYHANQDIKRRTTPFSVAQMIRIMRASSMVIQVRCVFSRGDFAEAAVGCSHS